MPSSLSSGLISLIPKGGDSTVCRQWRPITLLPMVYKILDKMISGRLRSLLPDLIHGSKTAFIQDILDNNFCFHQAVEWARSTGTPLRYSFSILRKPMTELIGIFLRALFYAWDLPLIGLEGWRPFTDMLQVRLSLEDTQAGPLRYPDLSVRDARLKYTCTCLWVRPYLIILEHKM